MHEACECPVCRKIREVEASHGAATATAFEKAIVLAELSANIRLRLMIDAMARQDFMVASESAAVLLLINKDLSHVFANPEASVTNERSHEVFQASHDLLAKLQADVLVPSLKKG